VLIDITGGKERKEKEEKKERKKKNQVVTRFLIIEVVFLGGWHTLTEAAAMASRNTYFSMYPQDFAYASHVLQSPADATASKYALTQTSALARAFARAVTFAEASPTRMQSATTLATAAA
jgi:hypothetical protein